MPSARSWRIEREQPLGLARGERRRRLVEHQDAGLGVERARDLDQLLLGDRERADDGLGPEGGAQALQHGAAAVVHAAPVDHPAPAAQLLAEVDVLGHRQVRGERQLLVDDRDAVPLGGDRVAADLDRLAVDQDLAARIGLVGAGEDLHQGRLAGAVLAHERLHLAAPGLELDVVERLHAGERLGDVAHLQRRHAALRCRPEDAVKLVRHVCRLPGAPVAYGPNSICWLGL